MGTAALIVTRMIKYTANLVGCNKLSNKRSVFVSSQNKNNYFRTSHNKRPPHFRRNKHGPQVYNKYTNGSEICVILPFWESKVEMCGCFEHTEHLLV